MTKNTRCLIAFFNTPSGRFRWWDEFPIALRDQLSGEGVDCHYFYKEQHQASLFSAGEIGINPARDGNGSLADERWLHEHVRPLVAGYRQVILHTHSYHPPFRLRRLIREHGRTTWVATVHRCPVQRASMMTRAYKLMLRKQNLLPEWYVGVSEATSRYLENNFGATKVATIHNGITLPASQRRDGAWLSGTGRDKRFLFLNRLDQGKGIELVIEALPRLLQADPGFRLTIVGDGPFRPMVEKFLTGSNAPNISWHGHTDDVARFYQNHDVLLLPYTRPQGLSLVSLEGRSYGLPAVYTPLGGAAETRDQSNGVAMREASADALIEAIAKIDDQENFTVLVDGCYSGLEYFSMQRMVDDYTRLYRRLFSDAGR